MGSLIRCYLENEQATLIKQDIQSSKSDSYLNQQTWRTTEIELEDLLYVF